MKNFVAVTLLFLISAFCIVGLAGLTCWGCFPSHRNAWWLYGVSSFYATCCLISIGYSTFDFSPIRRVSFLILSSATISLLIMTGIWFRSWLPSTGPPRHTDLFQLASLVPLLVMSLSFTPFLLRAYRGIHITNSNNFHERFRQHALVDLGRFGLLIFAALAIPVIANRVIGHPSSVLGIFVIFSIACVAVGSIILWPSVLVLLKFNWTVFSLASFATLAIGWSAVAFLQAVSSPIVMTSDEIAVTATAAMSGPILIVLFLLAYRLLGFRIVIPHRSFSTPKTTESTIHPLDAV